ncbi:MAG: hypothetical protein ACLRFK_02020 [Alphaproteobacteria bacterium]
MNLRFYAVLLFLIPGVAMGAVRGENSRAGVSRVSVSAAKAPSAMKRAPAVSQVSTVSEASAVLVEDVAVDDSVNVSEVVANTGVAAATSESCRDAYRACMDEFCLLDESEGYRCACSDNINASKSLIQEIQKIQAEADKLYTEGVERENLGAKAKLVFGESEAAKKSSRASGLSFADWLNTGSDADLDADEDIGDGLYYMASEFCAAELEACGDKADMEEMLYARQITSDCKAFSSYLADQKLNVEANKRTAESAVRQARLAMLDTTNKYNRGECLLAYRACIADKGGCGTNFENCLDADLLTRRAYACEGVLDQCLAVRDDVLKDWEAESESILADAVKFADKYRRQTCLAQIQLCLEDGCSTSTNVACLSDVNVAAGVCPIIDECNEIIPGLKSVVNDKLGYLRTQFCQNDIDACLRDKCGENFTAPECIGKTPKQIVEMCPQNMFPSCKNETQYDVIVSAAVLQMDYQMMQGCVNHFSEQLGRTCGTDMACLPADATVAGLTDIPQDAQGMVDLREQVIENSKTAVAEFFKQFEKETTVAACKDAEKPQGRSNMGTSIFNTAKLIAEIGAENRALRELETKIAELSRQQSLDKAKENCLTTYKVETPNQSKKNYSYVKSVSFEPSTRSCHVCRVQQTCEVGGESKAAAALKAASGGLTAGASMGTMVSPGWGTAIGGVVGAVGMGVMGGLAGGEKEFCQELENCEDVAM